MARVKLGDVAREYKATIKNATGLPTVGLEHLTPSEIVLERWDEGAENTFTKGFKKGHMLFGRRRAYLKKAALAPFDGICSGDIIVIEAIPEKIHPELLPFIIQNDLLFDYAVGNSAGSLSPRVKWESLKDYEFELPDLDKQDDMVELLKAAHRTRKAYQNQIAATDELVKSQFIERFDSVRDCHKQMKIVDACVDLDDIKCGPFGTQLKQAEYVKSGVAIWGIPQINSGFAIPPTDYVTPQKAEALRAFSLVSGDIAMSRKGNVGQCAVFPSHFEDGIIASDVLRIRVNRSVFDPVFLMLQLHLSEAVRTQILRVSDGSVMAGVNVTKLKNIIVYAPELAQQKDFVAFVQQSDKSKFELEQAVQRIDNLIKSLIQQDDN